jgi:hypothetical protein
MADYVRLDDSVYCGNGANPTAPAFWHASDTPGTIRNTAGPYLVLPDLRGQFVRGLDLAAAVDPGGAGRVAATVQAESIKQHEHDKIYEGAGEFKGNNKGFGAGAIETPTVEGAGNSLNTGATGSGIGAGVTNETRPVNMAFTWCIRY